MQQCDLEEAASRGLDTGSPGISEGQGPAPFTRWSRALPCPALKKSRQGHVCMHSSFEDSFVSEEVSQSDHGPRNIPLRSGAKGLAESVCGDASETGRPVSRECLAGGGPCIVIHFLSGPNTTPKSKTRYLELVCWWGVT